MPLKHRLLYAFAIVNCLLIGTSLCQAQQTPIQITADLSDAPRKLYHAEVDLPVTAGPLTLTTPKWIPGTHMPQGPAEDITGVVFTANGQPLAWRRDDVDLYQFDLTIPSGVTMLHAHLDCIVTARVTQKIAVLEWEKLLLYPANTPVKEIPIQPSLKVPTGWGIGTALTPEGGGSYPVPAAGAVMRGSISRSFPWRRRFRPSTILMSSLTSRKTRTCGRRFWPRWQTWYVRRTRFMPRIITTSTTSC